MAGRAMEPAACFWFFDAGYVGRYVRREAGKAALELSEEVGARWKRPSGLNSSEVEGGQTPPRDKGAAAHEGTCLSHGMCRDLRAVERPAPRSQLAGGEIGANPHCAIAVRALPGGTVGGISGAGLG